MFRLRSTYATGQTGARGPRKARRRPECLRPGAAAQGEAMIESILLVESNNLQQERLRSESLMNAKQLVLGRLGSNGTVLHVAATTQADLQKAILDFAGISGVTGVLTLAVRSGV